MRKWNNDKANVMFSDFIYKYEVKIRKKKIKLR